MNLELIVEKAFAIDCSRCANEDLSFEKTRADAQTDFAERGWTREHDGYQFCPGCNGGKR